MGSKEPEKLTDKKKIVPSASQTNIEATTSKDTGRIVIVKKDPSVTETPWYKKIYSYLYNRNEGTVCGRPRKSWLYILAYSFIYFLFLCTYTMVFLYATLSIIKMKGEYHQFIDKTELLTYSHHGVGLSATPADVNNLPLIWYKESDVNDHKKYVNRIDKLLVDNRRKRHTNESFLGPCGRSPYGYGKKPCVIIRINKQIGWAIKPIDENSSNFKLMPDVLKKFLSKERRRLLLNCDGYHQYDKEHVGTITYYPDPPGFDADIFPIDMQSSSPLVAIQISDFTLGISIAIECKLWYDGGTSSVHFLLYVTPNNTTI